MKSFIAFACVVCVFAFASQSEALPVADTDVAEANVAETYEAIENVAVADVEEHALSRQKRATCDLLSFTGANHALCAAHCIGHGKRGGYCNKKAVCVCRR